MNLFLQSVITFVQYILVMAVLPGTYYLGLVFKKLVFSTDATMITPGDIFGCYGFAFFILAVIVLFIYLYLNEVKRRMDEKQKMKQRNS